MISPLKSFLLITFFTLSSLANAGTTEPFAKRFELVRKEGKLIAIKDRSLSVRFSIKPYLKFIKEKLLEEQNLMNTKNDYNSEIEELFAEEFYEKGERNNDHIRYLIQAMEELKKVDIEKIFKDKKFKEVVAKFETKLGDAMNQVDPRIIARVDNPTFFYKRALGYQAVRWSLNFAKNRLSNIPVLNTALYIIVTVEKLIRERRLFHQNMMMHYFENFSEDELGLTHEEVNLVWSSIYESRIPWYAFWESTAAKENWSKYGVGKFFTGVRAANTRFREFQTNFSRVGRRFNFAFRGATYKGDDVIINMIDSHSQLDRKPSVAYYVHKPEKIKRSRIILQLAGLGISFVPVSSLIKNLVSGYFKSFYEVQKITEGALYGYFESNGAKEDMLTLRKQYQNPFDELAF